MAEPLSFQLDQFSGPLDLLLTLIQKHKLNIQDIELSALLDQYLDYLDACQEQDLEIAGEFLTMAARLIDWKTMSLLPKPEAAETSRVAKQELEAQLQTYARYQSLARTLRAQFIGDKLFTRPPTTINFTLPYRRHHDTRELLDAWQNLGQRLAAEESSPRPENFDRVTQRPVVSVLSKTAYLLRRIYHEDRVSLDEIYADTPEHSARIALFLAILELTRRGRILISDDGTYLSRRKAV